MCYQIAFIDLLTMRVNLVQKARSLYSMVKYSLKMLLMWPKYLYSKHFPHSFDDAEYRIKHISMCQECKLWGLRIVVPMRLSPNEAKMSGTWLMPQWDFFRRLQKYCVKDIYTERLLNCRLMATFGKSYLTTLSNMFIAFKSPNRNLIYHTWQALSDSTCKVT